MRTCTISIILSLFFLSAAVRAQTALPMVNGPEATDSQKLAVRLYQRITSTKIPLDDPKIAAMADLINKGDSQAAADIAIAEPNFINLTVREMASKMSVRAETIGVLNDYTATVLGVVRDDLDARQLLTGNFFYMADVTKLPVLPAGKTIRSAIQADVVATNNHFADLDANNIDLAAVLKKVDGQQIVTGSGTLAVLVPVVDYAGVLTSRTFMTEQCVAGTNRRCVEHTFREFMCTPMSEMADTGAPDLRVGQDVDRFPGGDANRFATSCRGCHSQMDSFRGAFAFWDATTTQAIYTPGKVASKYARNNTVFPDGYVVTNDSFLNNSNVNTNATKFGWRGNNIGYGNGVNQFAGMVANSQRFSQCLTKRVFESVCKGSFNIDANLSTIKKYATQFEAKNYSFKQLFRIVATSPECLGK